MSRFYLSFSLYIDIGNLHHFMLVQISYMNQRIFLLFLQFFVYGFCLCILFEHRIRHFGRYDHFWCFRYASQFQYLNLIDFILHFFTLPSFVTYAYFYLLWTFFSKTLFIQNFSFVWSISYNLSSYLYVKMFMI